MATARSEGYDFLRALYPDTADLYLAGHTKGDRLRSAFFGGHNAIGDLLTFADANPKLDCYYTVCPLSSKPDRGRGEARHAGALPCLWLDIDIAGPGHKDNNYPPTLEAALELARACTLPPSAIVHTGGGIHCYWLLEPWRLKTDSDRQAAHNLSKAFQDSFARPEINPHGYAYDRTADLARILRVPDTQNHKSAPPRPVRLLELHPDRRYSVEQVQAELAKLTPPAESPAPKPKPERPATATAARGGGRGRPDKWARAEAYMAKVDPVPTGGRNHRAFELACKLHNDFDLGENGFELLVDWNSRNPEPLPETELRQTFLSAVRSAQGPRGSALAEDSPQFRAGRANTFTLEEPKMSELNYGEATSLDLVENDLAEVSNQIWVTGGVEHNILADLCEVIPSYNKDNRLFIYEPTGQICCFNADFTAWVPLLKRQQLANVFERILGLEFWRQTDKGELRCNPPKEALERFLALGNESPLPRVKEFLRNPIVARDGTLVLKPGLHPAGLFYKPNVELPPVPKAPTPEQVREAVTRVNTLVADFPFADTESRQAWWAYLLTPMLGELAPRPWPMFNFSANLPGSGKGLLAGIPGRIMPPQPAAQALDQGSDSEIRKVLTAELASGNCGWLILDNVKGRLDSPSLEAFLTCENWTDRLLGSSKKGTWPVRTSVAVTANNLRLSKDLERRQVLIRLVSKTPEPELRNDFSINDLAAYIAQHRQSLVWSLCVILQNWLALGRPKGQHRLGSFERWSEAIGGLLDSAGIGSEFLASKRLGVAGDPEPWWLFVEAWVASTVSMDRQPVSELVRFAKQAGINLSDSHPASSLGRRLWTQDERPFRVGNQVYVLQGKAHGRQSLWSLVRARDEKHPKHPTEPDKQGITRYPTENAQHPTHPTNGIKPQFSILQHPTELYENDPSGVLECDKPHETSIVGCCGVLENDCGVSHDAFEISLRGVCGGKNGILDLHAREGEAKPDQVAPQSRRKKYCRPEDLVDVE